MSVSTISNRSLLVLRCYLTIAAQYTLPMISQQQLYSRFVKPGLSSPNVLGRNKLNKPSFFAFSLSSLTNGGVFHLCPGFSSWALYIGSAGTHSVSTQWCTFLIVCIAFEESFS